MSMLLQKMAQLKKLGRIWLRGNEKSVTFGIALVLVAVLSFEIGILSVKQDKDHTLVIEKPTQSIAQAKENTSAFEKGAVAGVEIMGNKPSEANMEKTVPSKEITVLQCGFVGSKNSTKYHSPSCSYAKRIKPENRVCFKTKEEAEARGYVPGCIQ